MWYPNLQGTIMGQNAKNQKKQLYTSSTFSKNKVCAIWHQTYPAGMAQVKKTIYCLLNTHPFYLSMHPQQGTDQFVCHLMKASSFIQFGNQFQ